MVRACKRSLVSGKLSRGEPPWHILCAEILPVLTRLSPTQLAPEMSISSRCCVVSHGSPAAASTKLEEANVCFLVVFCAWWQSIWIDTPAESPLSSNW